jgi:hypothetical protein
VDRVKANRPSAETRDLFFVPRFNCILQSFLGFLKALGSLRKLSTFHFGWSTIEDINWADAVLDEMDRTGQKALKVGGRIALRISQLASHMPHRNEELVNLEGSVNGNDAPKKILNGGPPESGGGVFLEEFHEILHTHGKEMPGGQTDAKRSSLWSKSGKREVGGKGNRHSEIHVGA